MSEAKFLKGDSDVFIGTRKRFERYLVCSLQGYFPVLVRTGPASLAVIYRTGAAHMGITGTLAVANSPDGGKSWSDPVELQPRWLDNRNPAFGVNAQGELIAAFWKAGLHGYQEPSPGAWQWQPLSPEQMGKITATFTCRSRDGGRSWSGPQPYVSPLLCLASPYGRIISAPEGTLLMPVYGTPRVKREGVSDISTVVRSRDGGATWGDESLVAEKYNETSLAFLPQGRLLAAARSESGHVATLYSDDLGRTWSRPEQVTREGEHPADVTVLQSGKVLLTFGRRIRPMGCGLLLSEDGGKSWKRDREVLLAGDGVENGDLGYPSTAQLADGAIVTVLYYAGRSEMTERWWGHVSCQAVRYREEDIV